MGSLFGRKKNKDKKKQKPALRQDEKALLDCKLMRDKVKQYIQRLEKNEKLKKEKAKEALRQKNKERARGFLRQAKMYSEQVKVADKQLEMIEDQINAIETATAQKEALQVLQEGNAALKKLQSEVNIEKWEKVGEDLDEMKEQQNEIAEFFKSRGLDVETEEEEINKELNDLMKQEVIDLPSANTEEIHVKNNEEEEKPQKQMVEA